MGTEAWLVWAHLPVSRPSSPVKRAVVSHENQGHWDIWSCHSVKGVSKSIKTHDFIEAVCSQIGRYQWERIKNKKERERKKERPLSYQSLLPPPLRVHLWKIQRIQNNHKYKMPLGYPVCTTSDPSRELQRTLPFWCLTSFTSNSSCCKVHHWNTILKHPHLTPTFWIKATRRYRRTQICK